ncbi:MAG: two-component sensor histidine kinase [Crocinitomicaceae bacterium]|jgi:two-component sensor histidine kinase
MEANIIIQHLVDISNGVSTINEKYILELEDDEDQSIALGLLTLHEEISYKREKLEISNQEKDTLLKEIHHRVKNNLQVVSSLLNLQSAYLDCEKSSSILQDSRMRVNTMARIHELLYNSKNLGVVNYKDYLQELVEHFKNVNSLANEKINIVLDVPSINLVLDKAIPLGLLINEILMNSVKYGLKGSEDEIYLAMKVVGSTKLEIKIGDNGPGYPDDVFLSNGKSLGVQLIRDLTMQLDGEIEKGNKDQSSGTHYVIQIELQEI